MLLPTSFPKWCNFTDPVITRLWTLYESGIAYPLAKRDADGRRVIFVQTRKMDPKVYTIADAIHLMTWIAKVILEEEETQIAGIVTIVDQSEITFGHIRLLSVSDIMNFVSVIKNGCVGRQKGMYMIGKNKFYILLC